MKKLKIYIIDDEPCIRDSLTWFLESLGCEVISESEPFSCQVYDGHSCGYDVPCADAILIDYQLPKINGLDFVEMQIKGGCKGKTKNILLMSGDITSIDKEKAEKLGCTVVQKPISLDYVRTWLESLNN